MIKSFIRWLFRNEYAQVQALLDDVKRAGKTVYVKYDDMPLDSKEFVFGINPLVGNRFVVAWLNRRRYAYTELMKYGPIDQREKNLGSTIAVDDLFKDLGSFELAYHTAIAEAKNDGE